MLPPKNEIRKSDARLRRLVSEFPWLWAIEHDWRFRCQDRVIVRVISDEELTCPELEDTEFWIKVRTTDREYVRKIPPRRPLDLATMILRLLKPHEVLEYIAIRAYNRLGAPTVAIYRAPKGKDLLEMCRQVVS